MTDFHDHAGLARMPMGLTCAAHRHESWVPFESHHVWPLGMGGPNVDSNRVNVCCNAHYAIHEFIDLLMQYAGKVPWVQARHYGPKVRALAMSGWEQAGRPSK